MSNSINDKKLFSANDFIKLGGLLVSLCGLYFALRSDIRDIRAEQKSDNKIVNSQIELLQAANSRQDNRTNELEKWKYKVDAILNDEPKIKRNK